MRTTTTLAVLLLCHLVYSQDWQTYLENESFTVYFSEFEFKNDQDGRHHKRIIFKFENHTESEVTLEFDRFTSYAESEPINKSEGDYQLSIPANSAVSYFGNENSKLFYVFVRDLNGTIAKQLKDFQLTNFSIN